MDGWMDWELSSWIIDKRMCHDCEVKEGAWDEGMEVKIELCDDEWAMMVGLCSKSYAWMSGLINEIPQRWMNERAMVGRKV